MTEAERRLRAIEYAKDKCHMDFSLPASSHLTAFEIEWRSFVYLLLREYVRTASSDEFQEFRREVDAILSKFNHA